MSTFFMLGKYTAESLKHVSRERTKQVIETVRKFGGEIDTMYALLGAYDLVLIVRFEDMKGALQASASITKTTRIGFSTLPAVTVDEFDELVGE